MVAALLIGVLLPDRTTAYETDQYTNRLVPLEDSGEILDAFVNDGIAEVVAAWRGTADDFRFAREIYWELGGPHWVDRIERFAMQSDEVEKLPQRRRQSIFRGAPVHATRVNFFFGVGRTIKIHDRLVGSDKLGHFFSQGLKYFRRHEEGWAEERVLARGAYAERWLFGQLTTGVYSNADLVANYEGYLFYRSLFEQGVSPGREAIVRWEGNRPVVQRPFTFADHVNDYWDEALQPSYMVESLRRFMGERLGELCDDYRSDPGRFVPRDESELERRYAELGLKPAPCLRLDRVCEAVPDCRSDPEEDDR